jgi:4-hydroxy-tetrahydrodipicolinate reductase
MQIIIVGAGKLASELLDTLDSNSERHVARWVANHPLADRVVVVHAGSGRELPDVVAYCQKNHATLVELATGSELEGGRYAFPVVICPNTNILMLKCMAMLAQSGHLFSGYDIRLTESHQSQKTSTPGTALDIARSLGVPAADVMSIRSRDVQSKSLNIPAEHMERHAYHQVVIEDGECSIKLETRIYGASPYVDGVVKIVQAIEAHPLEDRFYNVAEFVQSGWL